MYDFIKIAITDTALVEELFSNPLLDFNTDVNTKTGVLKDGVNVAEHENLKFTIYPSGRVEISGSLHKYWNGGHHNWNDFTLADVATVLKSLQTYFGIDPTKATVHNLEFGMNVNTPFNPSDLLNKLVVFKNEPFSKMTTRGQGHGKEVYLRQYGIKIYNKGLQYSSPNNILRFEKKVIKMECLNYGEVRLSTLLSLDFFNHCASQLFASFEEIVISDKVNEKHLTKAELKTFTKCRNPLEWGEMGKVQSCRNKPKFNQIISKYGEIKYKGNTLILLHQKRNLLTGVLKTKVQPFDRSINRAESCNYYQGINTGNDVFSIGNPTTKLQKDNFELPTLNTSINPRNFYYI